MTLDEHPELLENWQVYKVSQDFRNKLKAYTARVGESHLEIDLCDQMRNQYLSRKQSEEWTEHEDVDLRPVQWLLQQKRKGRFGRLRNENIYRLRGIADYGPGSGKKVAAVHNLLRESFGCSMEQIHLIDFSTQILDQARQTCLDAGIDEDALRIETPVDFEVMGRLRTKWKRLPRLHLFLGQTIGNFADPQHVVSNIVANMQVNDYLLVEWFEKETKKYQELESFHRAYLAARSINLEALGKYEPVKVKDPDGTVWNEMAFSVADAPAEKRVVKIGKEEYLLQPGTRILVSRSRVFDKPSEVIEMFEKDMGLEAKVLNPDKGRGEGLLLAEEYSSALVYHKHLEIGHQRYALFRKTVEDRKAVRRRRWITTGAVAAGLSLAGTWVYFSRPFELVDCKVEGIELHCEKNDGSDFRPLPILELSDIQEVSYEDTPSVVLRKTGKEKVTVRIKHEPSSYLAESPHELRKFHLRFAQPSPEEDFEQEHRFKRVQRLAQGVRRAFEIAEQYPGRFERMRNTRDELEFNEFLSRNGKVDHPLSPSASFAFRLAFSKRVSQETTLQALVVLDEYKPAEHGNSQASIRTHMEYALLSNNLGIFYDLSRVFSDPRVVKILREFEETEAHDDLKNPAHDTKNGKKEPFYPYTLNAGDFLYTIAMRRPQIPIEPVLGILKFFVEQADLSNTRYSLSRLKEFISLLKNEEVEATLKNYPLSEIDEGTSYLQFLSCARSVQSDRQANPYDIHFPHIASESGQMIAISPELFYVLIESRGPHRSQFSCLVEQMFKGYSQPRLMASPSHIIGNFLRLFKVPCIREQARERKDRERITYYREVFDFAAKYSSEYEHRPGIGLWHPIFAPFQPEHEKTRKVVEEAGLCKLQE